ncbi:hypothetical protein [Chondrinema litorale]|uniref:hypothetical protein n=1 Tax=Chondrinema litorale TaxID=2994555 RepID=UPI0025429B68|nr:hypothetical protein [Chondrinema litorale]UZS00283.1 hypothetical protein OQ292_40795 [Chondrinema litorale]
MKASDITNWGAKLRKEGRTEAQVNLLIGMAVKQPTKKAFKKFTEVLYKTVVI